MGRMKELWMKQVEDVYQDYADGSLGYEEARDLLLALNVDLASIDEELTMIKEARW